MLCYRCGSHVPDGSEACGTCGQKFALGLKPGPIAGFGTGTRRHRIAVESSPYKVGDILADRYEVKDNVGAGPVGWVFKCLDRDIDVDVSVKVLSPRLLQTPEDRQGVAQGLKNIRKLSHPNIVRVYEDGQDNERFFFTMQHLEGLTLRRIWDLRRQKAQLFSLREVEPIVTQMALALDYVHGEGQSHGDLKPDNVIILPDLLKITDFGLASALPRAPFMAAQKTGGVHRYLAPEFLHGDKIQPAADVYSLGVIVGEMLAGSAFEGQGFDLVSRNPQVPTIVDQVFRKAVSFKPEERFASAGELAEALRESLAGKAPRMSSGPRPVSAPKAATPAVGRAPIGRAEPGFDKPVAPPVKAGDIGQRDATEEVADDFIEEELPPTLRVTKSEPPRVAPSVVASGAEIENLPTPPRGTPTPPEPVKLPAPPAPPVAPKAPSKPAGPVFRDPKKDSKNNLKPVPPPEPPPPAPKAPEARPPEAKIKKETGPKVEPVKKIEPAPAKKTDPTAKKVDAAKIDPAKDAPKATAKPPAGPPPTDRTPIVIAALLILIIIGASAVMMMGDDDHKAKNHVTPPEPAVVQEQPPPEVAPDVVAPPADADAGAEAAVAAVTPTPPPTPVVEEPPKERPKTKAELRAERIAAEKAAKEEAKRKAAEEKAARDEARRAAAEEAKEKARLAAEAARANVKPADAAAERERLRGEEEARKAKAAEAAAERERIRLEEEARKAKQADALARLAADKAAADKAAADKAAADRAAAAEKAAADKAAADKAAADKAAAEKAAAATVVASGGGTTCPAGMRLIPSGKFKFGAPDSDDLKNFGDIDVSEVETGAYCIDVYEFPNKAKAKPTTGLAWKQAADACRAQKKRLCKEEEWERACKGPGNSRFPYGRQFDADACNTEDSNGEPRDLTFSGSFAKCSSGYGIVDMGGNAAEWTDASYEEGGSDKATKGGGADRPDFATRCAARSKKAPTTKDKLLGFRCCAEAK